MLENNLEIGERPEDLVIYAGRGKAARDWESYHRITEALRYLEEDETLVIQSGKPVGIWRTHPAAPLVVMANGNVTAGPSPEEFYELLDAGLTIWPGMTAAAWQYIGAQGIVQGTYESFMAAGRTFFGGSLAGRTILTGGCGGMGGAQPLAGKLAGASILVAEVHSERLRRRKDTGYLDEYTADVSGAIEQWLTAARGGVARSVGVVANVVEVMEALLERGILPDIVTDQTTTDPRDGYCPVGLSALETTRLRADAPDELVALARQTLARHARAMLEFQRRGSIVFEYGNWLRREALRAGVEEAMEIPSFVTLFIRPMFCEAIGPFRWIAISGSEATIATIDALFAELFSDVPRVTEWLEKAKTIAFTGLPARICWLGHHERTRAALAVNDLIRAGTLEGPVAFTRDHLDAGSASIPERETEAMADGSDAISDWALLNALLNGAAGADLIALHGLAGRSQSAGVTLVADGSAEAAERIERVLEADTGLGILRYADAGYGAAAAAAERNDLGIERQLAARRPQGGAPAPSSPESPPPAPLPAEANEMGE
jgi:urocanate hydratase